MPERVSGAAWRLPTSLPEGESLHAIVARRRIYDRTGVGSSYC